MEFSTMNEYLEEAKEELKRVDHIIYVSLKYTRTVDIIRNALHRMISAFDYIIEGILWYNKEKKKIDLVPNTYNDKIDTLKKLYKEDKTVNNFITFYSFLRELIKVPYAKREEYRRHVTMISDLDNKTAEINIDVLEDNFDPMAKRYLEYAELLVGMRKADE